ncbi:MAG: AEC family transporter [Armatimonadota bacterium]
MQLQSRLILMLSVILGSLALGYAARKLRWLPHELSSDISCFAMGWVQPALLALLIWGLEAPGWRTALLPAMLAVEITLLWPIGASLARLMGLRRPQAGPFTLACMFSNQGLTYGAFVCYILLGEQGAALGMIWVLSFMPMYYTLGFVIARRYGHESAQSLGETLLDTLREPESRNPLLGFAAGGLLYALGPIRPEVIGDVVDVLVPVSTSIFLFAIGLSLRLTSVVTYRRECAAIGAVKFLVTPALGLGMAWLAGFFAMEDHALLRVVFIQSAAPAAIMGLVLAQIFDLDEHLANAAWITSNVAAVALAPLLLRIAAGL